MEPAPQPHRIPILCLRITEALTGLINLVFTAYITNWHLAGHYGKTPGTVDLLLIASVSSLIALILIEFTRLVRPQGLLLCIECGFFVSFLTGFMFFAFINSDVAYCEGSICMAGRGSAAISAMQFSAWGASTLITFHEGVKAKAIKRIARGQPTYDEMIRQFVSP